MLIKGKLGLDVYKYKSKYVESKLNSLIIKKSVQFYRSYFITFKVKDKLANFRSINSYLN